MHILFIPSWYPCNPHDVSGSFFREQAQALKKQGCTVGVIAIRLRSLRDWRSVITGRYDKEFENDQGVTTYRKHGMVWFPRMPKLIAWLWQKNAMVLFEQYIKVHGKPDIIHVHSILYAGFAAKAISDKFQIPYVITEHSSAFACGLVTFAQKRMAEQVSMYAQKRFAVSRPFAVLLSDYFMAKNSPWDVMPNIVHERFLSYPIENRDKRESFSFINVALLSPNKGVDSLIKAFAKALSSQSNLKLKIAGDGSERTALEALAHDLGVVANVEFLGMLSREQVTEQMAVSDVFVLSSQYETFGVVVIEALALGRPVISTCCGGPEDIIRNEDGVLVPVNDVDALAIAMLAFYNDRVSYKSEEIREACRARYSEVVVAGKLIQVYNDVLGKRLQTPLVGA